MCVSCGCGGGHSHDHEHIDSHKIIDVEKDILHQNNLLAERNRGYFDAKEILCLNLVSSPGSGKTSLLEKTLTDLKDTLPFAVMLRVPKFHRSIRAKAVT